MNIGLSSIVKCGLATEIELVESYARYLFEEGKENEQPTDYIIIDGTTYTTVNINSKPFKYYKLVDLMLKRMALQNQ